jgi:hypothetical protein
MTRGALLLHLPRASENLDEQLVRRILDPICSEFHVQICKAPRHCAPRKVQGLDDVASDNLLFLVSAMKDAPAPAKSVVLAFRWACHKRHQPDWRATQQQARCDIRGGDETRVRRKRDEAQQRRRGRRPK